MRHASVEPCQYGSDIVVPCLMVVQVVSCAATSLGMNTQNLVVYNNHFHVLSDTFMPLFTQDHIMKHSCVDVRTVNKIKEPRFV
jgi:hypothetical protein